MDTLNIKNYHLETFIKALSYPMPFAKGRVKNKFMTILMDKIKLLEHNRLDMLTQLCEKKDGEPVLENTIDLKGNPAQKYKLSEDNEQKWKGEYNKMMMEEIIIDITPSLKSDLGIIKDIINKSTVELDNQETAIVEEILTALETSKPKKLPAKKAK